MYEKYHQLDTNQIAIVKKLKAEGFLVSRAGGMEQGFPDLIVSDGRQIWLVEVKSEKGKLRPTQEAFIAKGWPVIVIRSVQEFYVAVGFESLNQNA